MRFLIIVIITLALFSTKVSAQLLQANAGPDFTLCPNSTAILGTSTSASGGLPPYIYSWSPATGLNSNSVANPTLTAGVSTLYILTVHDGNDSLAYDSVYVTVPDILKYTAGRDTIYCPGMASNIILGNPINASAVGYTFNWSPAAGLNNPSSPNPVANPTTSTTYSLVVSGDGCSIQTGTVSVQLAGLTVSFSFKDTTIKEGTTITLYAFSSGNSYLWYPQNGSIHYQNTSAPEVNPNITTTYTLMVRDTLTGCTVYDTVRVKVTPDDELVFYSAFTPNSDGDNDFFYIGNIFKYPDNILKV